MPRGEHAVLGPVTEVDSPPPTTEDDSPPSAVELARRLASSARLASRRLTILPIARARAIVAGVQGRGPAGRGSVSPSDLGDLISSIGRVGMLQPILLEQLPGDRYRLVAGERRLRAVRWGAVHHPDNPHFAGIPAVVSPGPLDDEERRVFQLIENLAREDYHAGELGAALLLERCALLSTKLRGAGIEVPAGIGGDDDPVRRFTSLERLRGTRKGLAAPWSEVIARLGLRLSPRKARAVVAAFAALPPEVSSEMDAAGVSLWARAPYARLDAGRRAAAAGLWEAVKARGRPELLGAAMVAMSRAQLDPADALTQAEEMHSAANAARAARLRRRDDGTPGTGSTEAGDLEASRLQVDAAPAAPSSAAGRAGELVPEDLVATALAALRSLCDRLRLGERVHGYAAGSLRLYGEELLAAVGMPAGCSLDMVS